MIKVFCDWLGLDLCNGVLQDMKLATISCFSGVLGLELGLSELGP